MLGSSRDLVEHGEKSMPAWEWEMEVDEGDWPLACPIENHKLLHADR